MLRAIFGMRARASTALLYTRPVYTLLLPDEQTGETWGPSKESSFRNGEPWVAKYCSFCSLYRKDFLLK